MPDAREHFTVNSWAKRISLQPIHIIGGGGGVAGAAQTIDKMEIIAPSMDSYPYWQAFYFGNLLPTH